MKDYKHVILRLLTVFFLLTTSVSLSGCSFIGSIFTGAYDVVMWAPKKAWSYTGAKVFDVKNEQQTDLGPRRKPTGNPGSMGGMGMPGYPPAGAMPGYPPLPPNPHNMPEGSFAQPPYPPQGMNNFDQGMPQAFDQNSNMPQPAIPYPPANPYAANNGTSAPGMLPPPPASYPSVNPYTANNGAPAPGMLPPPVMPPYPPQGGGSPYYQGSPAKAPSSNPSSMGGMDPDSMEAEAAYSSAGGGGGGGQKKWWSWIPFTSSKYKMDIKYEPMAAEIRVTAKDLDESQYSENAPIALDDPGNTLNHNIKAHKTPAKSSRSASMFPLEQYAPKPTVLAQKSDDKKTSYPKLGDVPQNTKTPLDADEAAIQLEKMVNESESIQEKQAEIHNKNTKTEEPSTNENSPGNSNKTIQPNPQRYEKLGSEPLKNDSNIINNIQKNTNVAENTSKKTEQKSGFFSKLFHRSNANSSSKIIRRKSEPPKGLPINAPSNNIEKPLPQATVYEDVDATKKYQPYDGSLLPKSRYTDRRKVPQTDN